jgi:hypothetical protein
VIVDAFGNGLHEVSRGYSTGLWGHDASKTAAEILTRLNSV